MPKWICPECEGGFPTPVKSYSGWQCPWCGKEFCVSDKMMEDTGGAHE